MNQAQHAEALPAATHLVLVLVGGRLTAWQVSTAGSASPIPVQGQMQLPVNNPRALVGAEIDVLERMQDDGQPAAFVHLLADTGGRLLSAQIAATEHSNALGAWQVLAWEWLAERFGLPKEELETCSEQLRHAVLPWLLASGDSQKIKLRQEALERSHQDQAERLASERARLQRENEQLRAQNQALQQVDAEHLVSFLPALYPRVFTVMGPIDLALLCGRLEPLPIPNPYPEPGEETLRVLQKRFRDLPHYLQARIVGFVANLPQRQRLMARPEMRTLINELEGI